MHFMCVIEYNCNWKWNDGAGEDILSRKIKLEFFVGSLPSEVNIGHEEQSEVCTRVK